jgi:hypothetical protein
VASLKMLNLSFLCVHNLTSWAYAYDFDGPISRGHMLLLFFFFFLEMIRYDIA